MKRYISLLLVVCICLSFAACGNNQGTSKQEMEKSTQNGPKAIADKAYNLIKDSEDICKRGMKWRCQAFEFMIDYDFESSESFESRFAKALTGATEDEVLAATIELHTKASYDCFKIVDKMFENRGDYQKAEDNLKDAGKYLKELVDDDTYYSDLKEYYSAVSVYSKYFSSSIDVFENILYDDLKENIRQYEDEIDAASSSVSFLFE